MTDQMKPRKKNVPASRPMKASPPMSADGVPLGSGGRR